MLSSFWTKCMLSNKFRHCPEDRTPLGSGNHCECLCSNSCTLCTVLYCKAGLEDTKKKKENCIHLVDQETIKQYKSNARTTAARTTWMKATPFNKIIHNNLSAWWYCLCSHNTQVTKANNVQQLSDAFKATVSSVHGWNIFHQPAKIKSSKNTQY